MQRILRFTFCALLLLIVAVSSKIAVGESPHDGQKILLLRNGEVLRGKITLYGDNYLVTLPYGEIQISVNRVEHVCDSIQAGFRLKQSAIRFGSAKQHYQLAAWCLNQDVIEGAREEYEIAVSLEPDHPLAPSIARRLKAAQTKTDKDVAGPEPKPASDANQLDALAKHLPTGSVEVFTRSVQPLLVNGCSARACHGSAAENDFHLRRYPYGRLPPRRITLRNLESTLKWVDRRDPSSSRLLHAASHSHGLSRTSSILRKASQEKLREWILMVAEPQELAVPDTPRSKNEPGRVEPPGAGQVSRAAPGSTSLHSPAQIDSTLSPRAPRGPAQPLRPRDPFDPEIFNRRHHGV